MAKYIIIGLGNFGSALGQKLTGLGHEVVAVDTSEDKVLRFKDQITHTMQMDACDRAALSHLPLRDADACIVAIGEDFGASILTVALLKQLKARRIIARIISDVHLTVLTSIGVDQLIMPEEESAERLAKSLNMSGVLDSYELASGYAIVEAVVPERYIGHTVEEVDLRGKYNLNIVTVRKPKTHDADRHTDTVMGVIGPKYTFEADDRWVLFGLTSDLERIQVG